MSSGAGELQRLKSKSGGRAALKALAIALGNFKVSTKRYFIMVTSFLNHTRLRLLIETDITDIMER